MTKSFRLHLFILFSICFCIFLYASRLSSQYLASEFIKKKIQEDLLILATNSPTYNTKDPSKDEPFFDFSELNSLVICSRNYLVKDALCKEFKDPNIKWKILQDELNLRIEYADYINEKNTWHVVRKNTYSFFEYIAVNDSEVQKTLKKSWILRDHVVLYILPIMVLMMLLLSHLISNYVVEALNKTKDLVDKIDVKNLDTITHEVAKFKEFQPFLDVFYEMKRRLKTSFEQATRFSSDASHELKTPLTILRGYAERGIRTSGDGSNEQVQFSLMSEEIDRLINITEKLLMLARADSGRLEIIPTAVNLTDMLEQLVADAKIINPDFRITSQIQKKVTIQGDEQLIHQLIYNFYSNAIKYNISSGWIHFGLYQDERELVVEIINTAENLNPDFTEKAFDRFYRGEESHNRKVEGTGLGLSLCREIAKIHGGEILLSVNSNQHVSAKFRVLTAKNQTVEYGI